MNKNVRRNLLVLIILLIAIIFEIRVFTNSKADELVEITTNIIDEKGIIEEQKIILTAVTEADGNYCITLPSEVNGKKVLKFLVQNKEIVADQENSETQQETVTIVEKQQGDKIYLTEQELQNKEISIKVVYDTKQVEEVLLYASVLESSSEQNKISVEGYIPDKTVLSVTNLTQEEIDQIVLNKDIGQAKVNFAYDIKLVNNDTEYDISTTNEKATVVINNVENLDTIKNKYKILHIHEEEVQEITEMTIVDNSITFEVDKFSTFALLAEQVVEIDESGENISLMSLDDSELSESADSWDGTLSSKFKYGNGTKEQPYLITSAEDLSYLAEQVNAGNSYKGKYFQLTNDINLKSKSWTPIGTTTAPFQGVFDGAGHVIANAIITVKTLPTDAVDCYGLFGSIGGADTETVIKNLELNSIEIKISIGGTTSGSSNGIHIGTVTGNMYSKSKIENVMTKNGLVSDSAVITIDSNEFQLAIGGMVGFVTNTATSTDDPGEGNRYSIKNCFSDVDIDVDATVETVWFGTTTADAQYHTGGIVGTIRSQPVWPEQSLYVGNINSNGFIGPIFGALINTTSYTDRNNYDALWQGNDAGALTITSYYSAYQANGTSYTTDRLSGTTVDRANSWRNNIGYVQGVNKGNYEGNISNLLDTFNSYSSDEYMTWVYSDGTFSFNPRFNVALNSNEPTYAVIVTNTYETEHTYKWYINGALDESLNNSTSITKEKDIEKTFNIDVLVYDGLYYGIVSFKIDPISLYVVFDVDEENKSVKVTLDGDALPYVNLADYTYQWYTVDISDKALTKLENKTGNTLENLQNGVEYHVIATNTKKSSYTRGGNFIFGTRTVIYVDETNGKNNNDGLTPTTAVANIATAYTKLASDGERVSNIIVVIGEHTSSSFFNSATATTYNKKATITGMYNGIEYNGDIDFEGENNYKYLTADTTFQHVILNAGGPTTNWWGSETIEEGQTYFFLQGYSLTMGEGVEMQYYSTANTNQGLINGNSPGFHVIAGWLRYNYSNLPRNNPELIIKSGTYGRIILGGSPGTNSASNLQMTTSRNFTGTKDNLFNVKITVDIQKSTTPSNYDYDINLLVGGMACGNIYANVTENIKNGKIGRILGASIGDTSNKPNNWNYPINTFLGTTTINILGGEITELYGGCLGRNMSALSGSSSLVCDSYFYGTVNINISGGTVSSNIYGAGAGGVSGYSQNSTDTYKSYGEGIDTEININVSGGTINGNIYGGGYGYTEYLTAAVTATDAGALYGNSNINISGGTINGNVYGAGCGSDNVDGKTELAQMEGKSNIKITDSPVINGSVYGAGMGIDSMENMAKMTGTSNITLNTNTNINIYGGGNISKLVGTTNLNVNSGTHTANIYGGGNIGIVEGSSNIYLNGGNIASVFGGGQSSNITESYIYLQGAKLTNIYGGSNITGNVENTYITTTSGEAKNIFGGNNKGGKVNITNININGGNITDVYGGGNEAEVDSTNVNIYKNVKNNIFGGGNQAKVNNDTTVLLLNANIGNNVYGGGNEGIVIGNTYVNAKDSIISGSIYAGGNGASATVYKNTNLVLQGKTEIKNNAFAGGNQAATGLDSENNSESNMNIVGAKISGNVYGGANTSVVYGITNVKIGYNAVEDDTLQLGDIEILGTVFGGGEANASGSEEYDFDFTSVTKGIDILIDGDLHEKLSIKGSIFGSGNASNTQGASNITIKNYGTKYSPMSNVSIQRTNCAKIINSAISLSGAKDRTNEFNNVYFSLSRVDEVKLIDNSMLYLSNGANLLTKIYSIVSEETEEKGKVTIDKETGEVTRNVDNRIYMLEGKNLNIATNQAATAYGQVSGMLFFGMFTNKNNPSTSTGIYNQSYVNGDSATNIGTFSSNSYIKAQHMTDHDITIDGFYTNANEDGKIKQKYIETTPEDDVYYIWLVGEKMDVTSFEFTLTASKYSTIGTTELLLEGFGTQNSKFSIIGFSSGLLSDVELINPDSIEAIAKDEQTANNIYGLSMSTGNRGWQTDGTSNFLTENGGSYIGENNFAKDNTSYAPTLNFCFYHSKNITLARDLGNVKIRLQVVTPIDELNDKISYIDIDITMLSTVNQNNYYEATITPGQEFGLFTTTDTTITSNSAFSAYYSLFMYEYSTGEYKDSYKKSTRVLVSRDKTGLAYSFPENTKITMLDLVTDKIYYYIVTAEDVQNNKYEYALKDFVQMGSTDGKFDETEAIESYIITEQDVVYEEFVFQVNFADATFTNEVINNSLLIELKNANNQTLIGVLGQQRDSTVYTVYPDKDATINVDLEVEKTAIYLGDSVSLNVTTDFTQEIVESKTVYDTAFFEKKLGVKISIYDSDNNKLSSDSLLGAYFELDGQKYYPRIDGTTRIKIGDKVTNVLAKIKFNTENNKILATGEYTIKIESFGSSDGIYYGLVASDEVTKNIKIINSSFGLNIITSDDSKIIDGKTGKNATGRNSIVTIVEYESTLEQPKITLSLYRRDYNEQFSTKYNLVDYANYASGIISTSQNKKEYLVLKNPAGENTLFIYLKNNLMTGTYKLVYKLYDGENYIDEAYEYVIIK